MKIWQAAARKAALAALTVLLLTAPSAAQEPADEPFDPSDLPRVTAGRGENEMVLIHSLGSKAAVWDKMKPYLMGTFKVETFEMAGHGATQPVAYPSIATEVERLGRFLEQVDYPYPVLVGHGLGGMVALQYTLENPGKVRRLILMDSAPRQMATDEEKADVARQLVEHYDEFVAQRFLNMTPDEEITNEVLDTALRTHQPTFTTLLMSSFDYDLTDKLPTLTVPLLVVGSQLMFPTDESSRHMLAHYGYADARALSFKRIENCGHFMMLERTVYTASVILAFSAVSDRVIGE